MSLEVLPLKRKSEKKDFDKMPFKLFKIVTVPVESEDGKKILIKSQTHKIAGKCTYYHHIITGEETGTVIFMVIGGDGTAVFEMDAERVYTCTLVGEEEVEVPQLLAIKPAEAIDAKP